MRKGIRRAERGGVRVEQTGAPARIAEFVTLCDTITRLFRLLGAVLGAPVPHEMKLKLAQIAATSKRMRLFKRNAPNGMKKEDLYAKSCIIPDPQRQPGDHSDAQL